MGTAAQAVVGSKTWVFLTFESPGAVGGTPTATLFIAYVPNFPSFPPILNAAPSVLSDFAIIVIIEPVWRYKVYTCYQLLQSHLTVKSICPFTRGVTNTSSE